MKSVSPSPGLRFVYSLAYGVGGARTLAATRSHMDFRRTAGASYERLLNQGGHAGAAITALVALSATLGRAAR